MNLKPIKPTCTATVYRDGAEPFNTIVTGRVCWALLQLMRAGKAGCTPISKPAPRWSDYVFRLKKQGISVGTIVEGHDGSFAGHHAKYELLDRVTVSDGNLSEYLASPEGRREFGSFDPMARRAA